MRSAFLAHGRVPFTDTLANLSGAVGGGEHEVSNEDAVQGAAAGSEQAGRSRRNEEEPAGQVVKPGEKLSSVGFICQEMVSEFTHLSFLFVDVGRSSRMWWP